MSIIKEATTSPEGVSSSSLEDTLQWILQDIKEAVWARLYNHLPGLLSSLLQGQEAVSISVCLPCLNQSLEIPCSGSSRHQGVSQSKTLLKTLQGGHIFLLTPLLNVSQPYLVPSPNSGPLRSHSEFTLLPILCLPSSLVDCRVTPSSFLAPIPLPSPFTDVYTSLCTKRQNYTSLVWRSVFKPSEFSTILVYVSFTKSYRFQLGICI